MKIGVISDTHGFLDGRVYHIFDGVQHILHAGDVQDDLILDELQEIAPVNAVSGNVDYMINTRRPLSWTGELFGLRIAMTHGHMLDPRDYNKSAANLFAEFNPHIIIHGHSHIAKNEEYNGIRILNPGAACKPRFSHIASVAIITVNPDKTFLIEFQELPRVQ